MKFSLPNYCSDGPGYQGQIDVNYSPLTRGLVITAGDVEMTYVVPKSLPKFVRTVANSDDVAQKAFIACSGSLGDYDAEEFLESRIVTMEFVGGLLGYFIVFGEPCFAALAIGNIRYALQEAEITAF